MKLLDIQKIFQEYQPSSEEVNLRLIPNKGIELKYVSNDLEIASTFSIKVDVIAQMSIKTSCLLEKIENYATKASLSSNTSCDEVVLNNNKLEFKIKDKTILSLDIDPTSSTIETPYEIEITLDKSGVERLFALSSFNDKGLPNVIFGQVLNYSLKLYGFSYSVIAEMRVDLKPTGFDTESEHLQDFVLPSNLVNRIIKEHKPQELKLCLSSWNQVKIQVDNFTVSTNVQSAKRGIETNKDRKINIDNIIDVVLTDIGKEEKLLKKDKFKKLIEGLEQNKKSLFIISDNNGIGSSHDAKNLSYACKTKASKSNQQLLVELKGNKLPFIQLIQKSLSKEIKLCFPTPETHETFAILTEELMLYFAPITQAMMLFNRPAEEVPVVEVKTLETQPNETPEELGVRQVEQLSIDIENTIKNTQEVYVETEEAKQAKEEVREAIQLEQSKLCELQEHDILTSEDIDSAILLIKTKAGTYFRFVLGDTQQYQLLFDLGQNTNQDTAKAA